MRAARRACPALALLLLLVGSPDAARANDGPSRRAVAEAVSSGAAYLKSALADGDVGATKWNATIELVMLTLAHSGVTVGDKTFKEGLKQLGSCELAYTYRVATMAMALRKIDPQRHRRRLAHCAQWLVDTQLPGGEWGYPVWADGFAKPVEVAPPFASGPDAEPLPEKIQIKRVAPKRKGKGDFSNTQFAILGLKACLDCGIEVPDATWKAALGYIVKYQQRDGSWGYVYGGEQDAGGYASLTCAGVCSVALCWHALGKKNPGKHKAIVKGLAWLARKFRVDRNVDNDQSQIIGLDTWLYYYLYSIERVGKILDIDTIGEHAWYPKGATFILAEQRGDGSWTNKNAPDRRPSYMRITDTCFAILFLTRATPGLVLTGD